MFTAYLDESGTHKGSDLVVAGFSSTNEGWITFERAWQALLRRHGLTHVHSIDLAAFSGEFKAWNPTSRRQLLQEIVDIVNHVGVHGCAAVLFERDYIDGYPQGEHKRFVQTRYGLCFRMCMVKMATYVSEHFPGQKLSIVLEAGHANCRRALQLFEMTRRSQSIVSQIRIPLRHAELAKKRNLGALQLADLLAYNTYRNARALVDSTEPHADFNFLMENIEHEVAIWRLEADMLAGLYEETKRIEKKHQVVMAAARRKR